MCCSSKDAFKGVCGGGLIHTADTAMCTIQPRRWPLEGELPPSPRMMGAPWPQEIRETMDNRDQDGCGNNDDHMHHGKHVDNRSHWEAVSRKQLKVGLTWFLFAVLESVPQLSLEPLTALVASIAHACTRSYVCYSSTGCWLIFSPRFFPACFLLAEYFAS